MLRSMLGIRSTIRVEGVAFRERTAEPVARALAPGGSGRKDYRVTFPDGARMTISLTRDRPFADLVPSPLEPIYDAALEPITPGMRIAALRVLTGDVGRRLSTRVGPSGGVVALDPDAEAIRFARRRYPLPNVSFEAGGIAAIEHEPPASFDALLAIGALGPGEGPEALAGRTPRLVRPGGLVIVAQPVTRSPVPGIGPVPTDRLSSALRAEGLEGVASVTVEGWGLVAGRVPGAVRSGA